MTIKELCSKIAALEGLKHEASIGDVREIVGLVSDELFRDNEGRKHLRGPLVDVLLENGKRRAKRKPRLKR